MLELEIKPVQVFPDTATKLRVPRVEVRQPGDSGEALVSWQILSAAGEPLKEGNVVLRGDDYNTWGAQDRYLLDYVSLKIGVQPAPIAIEVSEVEPPPSASADLTPGDTSPPGTSADSDQGRASSEPNVIETPQQPAVQQQDLDSPTA